jgi:predicted ATPase
LPLEKIKVDGFRSLNGFEIQLHRGLNVLVGANGSGKTNFIKLLDFLAALTDHDLNVALRMAGGASEVFSREQIAKTRPTLSICLSGAFPSFESLKSTSSPRRTDHKPDEQISPKSFEYELKIVYDKSKPRIFIQRESIKIFQHDDGPTISIERSSPMSNSDEIRVRPVPIKNLFIKALAQEINYSRDEGISIEDIFVEHVPEEYLFLFALSNESLTFQYMLSSISTFRSVNIDPSLARQPSPVGISYSISNKGEGLASIIQSLRKNRFYPLFRPGRFLDSRYYRRGEQILERITDWISEVNQNVVDIDVELEAERALLIAYVSMRFGEVEQRFALDRLSDGTVKWIALVCTLLTNEQNSVIEEPENFLHPQMQEVFVSLCESVSQSREYFKEIIVSTHSETLLNRCKPSDLIYFTYDQGGTRAHAIRNEQELSKLILESNFGLGYFYRIGGVDV